MKEKTLGIFAVTTWTVMLGLIIWWVWWKRG